MITEIKFRPELSRWYRPRVWISCKLWDLACWVHPWPPKFREDVASEIFKQKAEAKILVDQMMKEIRRIAGLDDL